MAGRFTIETVFRAIDQMSRPLTKMRRTADRFAAGLARPLRRLDRQMGRVHATTKRAALGMAALGAGAAAVGASVARSGMSFEQSITNVGAVMLKTRGEIGELEKKALSLGATTRFTASEVAQGMEILAKGGFQTGEILQSIDGVMAATAASGGDLAEVSGHVTGVLKGMGMAASEAGRVADVLTLASSRTNSTISSLGESMQNVASKARALGIPLEETVAAVALLQDSGLDASVAGSALNTMLSQLAAPSVEIAKKMEELGVSFQDAKGDMLPLAEVLANIAKGIRGSGGNMAQAAFLVDLVGMRGEKAASQLASLGEKQVWQWTDGVFQATNQVEALTGALKKAHEQGTAGVMADLKMGTLGGDLLLLESAIDGVKTALFEADGAPLRGLVQSMTAWVGANQALIVSGVSDYITGIRDNWEAITSTLKRVGRALVVFYGSWLGVKTVIGAIDLFRSSLDAAEKVGVAWTWTMGKAGKVARLFRLDVLASAAGTATKSAAMALGRVAAVAYGKGVAVAGAAARMLRLHTVASTAATIAHTAATKVAGVAMRVFGAVARGLRIGMLALNAAMYLNPVGLIVAGLVAAGVAVYAFWPQIKGLFSWIAEKAVAIYDWFSETFSGVVRVVRETVTTIKAIFGPLLDLFGSLFDADGGVSSLLSKGAGLGDGLGALMGGGDTDALAAGAGGFPGLGGDAPEPQMVSPRHQAERTTNERTEHHERESLEITIRDESAGRAEVAKAPKNSRISLRLEPSGAF